MGAQRDVRFGSEADMRFGREVRFHSDNRHRHEQFVSSAAGLCVPRFGSKADIRGLRSNVR